MISCRFSDPDLEVTFKAFCKGLGIPVSSVLEHCALGMLTLYRDGSPFLLDKDGILKVHYDV